MNFAADDFTVIHRELRRNRVIEMGIQAGLVAPADIPPKIFLAAGFTTDEVNALLPSSRRWPILESELR